MWKIGIRNPLSKDSSKSIGVIQIANGAVASSGGYVHKVENISQDSSHRPDHHIIHPKTGKSGSEVISSTILSTSCLESDTLATIVMNMQAEEAKDYLTNNDIFDVIINKDGKSLLSHKALSSFSLL
jgi:thiamine biosynthesis lipoprotein